MRYYIAILLLITFQCAGQSNNPNILEARRSGVQVIKHPSYGILKVEVSEEYHNLVMVELCGSKRFVQLACREDYNVTLTTATGRIVTITDFKDISFGTIKPSEFPVQVDVKVKRLVGEERLPLEFSMLLLYKGYCYRVFMYDEWTGVQGIKK